MEKKPQVSTAKRAAAIAGISAATLAAAQMVILGVKGGIGPLGFLKKDHTPSLPGNAPAYDFSGIVPLENSPLKGKNVCVLGSSVVFGAASQQNAVGEYLAARFDCALTKEAVSGTTLADKTKNSYVRRLKNNLDPDAEFDLFICQLSTNDATARLPLGRISNSRSLNDFNISTVTGAMEYIICYAQQTWGCPVAFFTSSYYDSARYSAMVERIHALSEKWGIGVLDLYTPADFNNIPDADRKIYMSDKIHPTKAGYRDWWGPELERQLTEFLKRYGGRFYES